MKLFVWIRAQTKSKNLLTYIIEYFELIYITTPRNLIIIGSVGLQKVNLLKNEEKGTLFN
jgi:hypothetical protein